MALVAPVISAAADLGNPVLLANRLCHSHFHIQASGCYSSRSHFFGFRSTDFVTCEKKLNYATGNGAASGQFDAEGNGSGPEFTANFEEFFVSEVDGDPDRPSKGFSSIVEAVEAISNGKFVIVVDRKNTGSLVMAGSVVTSEAITFLLKHYTGIVYCTMTLKNMERLKFPTIPSSEENNLMFSTAFTVPVDVIGGTSSSSSASASNMANTILALSSPLSRPEHFVNPGHIFPLQYQDGGVLARARLSEASVDLAVLAGLPPISILGEVLVDEESPSSQLQKLQQFAKEYNLPIISISDLIRYRHKREALVERTAVARLPTQWGTFKAYSYTAKRDGIEHVALVKGDIGDGLDVLVRVHSECLTGDIFGSKRCDCGDQLSAAMQQIEIAGRGVLVYLRGQEGRGIGLGAKLRAYNLQDEGRDTVDANLELGLPVDARDYGIGAQILRDIGVRRMKLMTNNPSKCVGLKGYGLALTGRIPVVSSITAENTRYLETKRLRMGHLYASDLPDM